METTNSADGNNSFTHCPSTTMNVTSSSQSQSTSLLKSMSSSLLSGSSLTGSVGATATSAFTLPHSSKSLSAGAIAGIAVGSIAFVGVTTLFLLWLLSCRRRQADIEDSETSPTPFIISDDANTPSMSNSAGTAIFTNNPESGAWRRLRMKEQREPPPRYTE
ncbi:hypothetical protein F5146DRAFT_717477 [Armillaria mellea]|nr:hypothetical protein F5146DRAFT_717477 [Armillaria mellea]